MGRSIKICGGSFMIAIREIQKYLTGVPNSFINLFD